MGAPSIDVKDILVGTTITSSFASTADWGVYISQEPDQPSRSVTLYDSGGAGDANPKFLLEEPTIQIRIRGNPDDYTAAYDKANDIRDTLLGRGSTTVNGTLYVGFWQQSDIIYLRRDERDRPIFVSNWRLVREPSSGTHRTSL